jgi:hypothetical protein
MSSIRSLNTTEGALLTARALVDIAHFIVDHAEGDDFQRMKTPFGFLLNTLSAELRNCDQGVGSLYREHFAANDKGRAS